MPQVTIYLDDETNRKMIELAKKSGQSKSRWIAGLIREKTANEWPDEVLELIGAWRDETIPSAGEIRAELGEDVPREPL